MCSGQTEGGGTMGVSLAPAPSSLRVRGARADPRSGPPDAEMDGVSRDLGGSGPGVQPFNAG